MFQTVEVYSYNKLKVGTMFRIKFFSYYSAQSAFSLTSKNSPRWPQRRGGVSTALALVSLCWVSLVCLRRGEKDARHKRSDCFCFSNFTLSFAIGVEFCDCFLMKNAVCSYKPDLVPISDRYWPDLRNTAAWHLLAYPTRTLVFCPILTGRNDLCLLN